MKRLLFISTLLVSLGVHAQSPLVFTVDTKLSTMRWTGYYLFSFGEHTGTIQLKKGELTLTNGLLTGGNFEIDMTSIKDTDMKEDDGGNDLTNHLKNDDFFSVEKFPAAQFEITKVEKIKDSGPNQPNYDITGVLTLKGSKNTLIFPAIISNQGKTITAFAKFKFDRTKWNVKYSSGKFFSEVGDGAISDAIGIELNINATQL